MGDIALSVFQETLERLISSSELESIRKKKRRFRSLKEIEYMREFLKVTEKKRYEHSEVMNLVRQIKNMGIEAENIVERYVTATMNAVECHPSLHLGNVMKKIKTLTAEIKKIYNENVYDINGAVGKNLEHSVSKIEECNTSRVAEEKVLVGLEKEVETLMGKLLGSGEGKQLEIISIVGAAGGGKTTLANEVYHHPLTSHTFQIRVWINISQDYNKTLKRNLLVRILESTAPQKHEDHEKSSEDELGEKAHKYLKGKKYLIVMDDIWGVEAWNDIKRSLPKECNSSKVLFTSRLIVQPNGIHYVPHYVVPLSKSCSWNLLQKKVFGKKHCPQELVDIGEHIAEKCKGLPLAIVAIAGILAVEDKKLKVWEKVSKNLSSIITKNQERCMEILELSYNHLPLQLKPCFVYIGGFPEDSEILVQELIWLWIAEGFIQQTEGDKSLEDIAKDYLSSLMERNLVMEARKMSFEGIKACRIHDLLRELCLKKAEEDNFLVQNYGDHTFSPSATTKHRRLFIGTQSFHQFSTGTGTDQNLRSFLCLRLQNSKDLSFESDLSFFIENFELLRVLCFESVLNCQGKGRGYLVHLRYLALKISERKWDFKVPFSNLFNLETLYIKYPSWTNCSKNILLPRNLFEIIKLRHLYAKEGTFNYHHSKLDHSSKLYNLQTLHKICSCELCRNFLVSTPNLRKLGFRKPFNYTDSSSKFLNLEFLKCLEDLNIAGSFWGSTLPPVLKFPPTIMRLTLDFTWLKWEELSILLTALPSLEVLKLKGYACKGPIWNTTELEGFSKLKYLRLQQLDIKEWNSSADQFPMLEVLVVKWCHYLEQIPINFANLNELRQIAVSCSGQSTEKSAREIQEERRNERGDDGCIELLLCDNDYCGDDDSGENLCIYYG